MTKCLSVVKLIKREALENTMLDEATPTPIAQIQELRVEFQTQDGPVLGVENVSFDINAGETVCVGRIRLG